MKYEVEVGYDRITNFDAPGYTNKELSTFLSQAQKELVLEAIKVGVDVTEENRLLVDALKTTTTIAAAAIAAGNYRYSYLAAIPTNAWQILNEYATIKLDGTLKLTYLDGIYADQTIYEVPVIPITEDEYNANKNNPHKKPTHERLWRFEILDSTTRKHELVTNGAYTIVNYYIRYLKSPSPIIIKDTTYVAGDGAIDGVNWSSYTASSLDCALAEVWHKPIVDRAINLAYAALKDKDGYQISTIQENKS